MSRIEDLRASIEHRIDALEHQATALESQLMQTKEEAIQRLEQGKQQLRDVVTALQTELRTSKAVVDVAKAELQARLDHLRVQLALGKAEADDTLEQQREKIFKALSEFEFVADQKLAETAFESGRWWEALVGRASRLAHGGGEETGTSAENTDVPGRSQTEAPDGSSQGRHI